MKYIASEFFFEFHISSLDIFSLPAEARAGAQQAGEFGILRFEITTVMSIESELGKLGEALAAEYLRKKDHIILEQNYKWEKSEVDIIATKNDRIIFVEVKTRQSPYLSDPALMVPIKKWKQIMKAADIYMKENEGQQTAQFDIVHVVTNKHYTKIDHYDEAFTPGVSH